MCDASNTGATTLDLKAQVFLYNPATSNWGAGLFAGAGFSLDYDDPLNLFSTSVGWFRTTNGSTDHQLQLMSGTNNAGGFGKSNALGDMELLCDPAPLEIGNRVWEDVDHDGIQDADEHGIEAVTLTLIDANGNTYTTVTDSEGEYYFNSSNVVGGLHYNAAYTLTIDTTQSAPDAHALTQANADSGTILPDGVGSDGVQVAALAQITFTTSDPSQNDNNLDFGFEPAIFSLGNRVSYDTNNDGSVNNGADGGLGTGVSGVTVQLLDVTNTLIMTATTDAMGYYRFDGLDAGDYTVLLPAVNFAVGGRLQNYQNSSATFSGNTDAEDNGVVNGALGSGGDVRSGVITLGTNLRPIDEIASGGGDYDPNDDDQDNLTVDFGFYRLTLDNRVWIDINRDGLDGAESGAAGIQVTLTISSGLFVAAATTDASGFYTFTNLISGAYIVQMQAPTYYVSSRPDDTTTNTEANDNGEGTGGGVNACGSANGSGSIQTTEKYTHGWR